MTDSQTTNPPWGAGSPARLPVRDTARQAYGSLWFRRDDLLRLAILPVLMSLSLQLVLTSKFDRPLVADTLGARAFNVWAFLLMLLGWFPLTLFAVNWLRVLLLGRDAVMGLGLRWGMRETKFLIRMVLILVVVTLIAVAAVAPLILVVGAVAGTLGLPGTGPASPGQTMGALRFLLPGLGVLLVLAVQLYLGHCVSLALPATALDRSRVIRLSWALTRGVTFRLAAAFLLVTVPFYAGVLVLGWTGVYRMAPASGTLVGVLVNFIAMAAGFAVLAIAYRRLGGLPATSE